MNTENKLTKNVNEQPDFVLLCEALRVEVIVIKEHINRANYLSNNLRQMPEPKLESQELKDAPIGIVQTLWSEIYRLRDANLDFQRTLDHLQQIIG